MQDLEIIILAGGKGTRMGHEKPKVLTEIKGRPMLSYLLDTVKKIHDKKPLIVVGYKAEEVKKAIDEEGRYVLQDRQLGTGHAVATALPHLSDKAKDVMVLYGDHPLVDSEAIFQIYNSHKSRNNSPITLGTVTVEDYLDWRQPFYDFGRIIRNKENKIVKITEKKDAESHELEIKEVNPSYFCFDSKWLKDNIKKLNSKNAQGEYYLTDLIGLAQSQGFELNSCIIPTFKALGVNTPEQLALVTQFIK